ncbi:neuroglobin-like [Gigantopelta aegis]|uniref:neuroglobin-like n=1 Tax=Gigantopelta aegis TaxID=1735272 RepID=UPI001B88DBD7|nr:neuroglobin-like [Gigantopelta aegis]XP_041354606.1 neuroglobin-like [Gigantopelta aegis]
MEDKHIELLHSSWDQFKEGDLLENGAHTYFRLFSKYPTAKDLFNFHDNDEITLENFRQNEKFCFHLKMVFKETIANVIKSLNDLMDLAALVPFLQELGGRHHTRGITKYFDAFGECLYYALERKLGSDFTPEVKEAWVVLFGIIETNMKIGMSQQAKKEDA